MARQPAMRTSNARDMFQFLVRNYPAVGQHLRDKLPPHVLERIEHAARTDWIPVELDGQNVDEVLAAMGEGGMRDAYRRFTREALISSPAMRSIVEGVLRIFGVSVGTLLRALPGAMRQSYRDAFTLEIQRTEHEALVILNDIAPEVLRFRGYPIVWEGVFLGAYDIARAEPRLDFKLFRGTRRAEARFRW
jgi:hypothetical protein